MSTRRFAPTIPSFLVIAGIAALAACGGSSHQASTSTTTSAVVATTSTTAPLLPSLLPEPTGPNPVGVRMLTDVSPQAAGRVWYPAKPGTGSGEPEYISSEEAGSLGVTVEQLSGVRVRATLDATPAPADTPRPGVVLMPGWSAPMAVYTALAQDLASNGYVVVTIDPAPGSEDGTTLPADLGHPGRRVEQLAAAVDFITGPKVAPLAGPVDPKRIATGGHSIAGAVAFQASLTDRRLAAVFDMDGWLHGAALDTPITVPALAIEASGFDEATTAAIVRSSSVVAVKLAGASHFDVSDVPCLVPALGTGVVSAMQLGTIGRTGTTTANALVIRFLDAVVRDGRPTPTAATLSAGLDGVG